MSRTGGTPVHQEPRVGPRSRTTWRPSASPTTPRTSSATWSSSSCPRRARPSTPATPSAPSRASRPSPTSTPRSAARSSRSTSALEDSPEKINEDPYGEGWIVKLRISDEARPPLRRRLREAARRGVVGRGHRRSPQPPRNDAAHRRAKRPPTCRDRPPMPPSRVQTGCEIGHPVPRISRNESCR